MPDYSTYSKAPAFYAHQKEPKAKSRTEYKSNSIKSAPRLNNAFPQGHPESYRVAHAPGVKKALWVWLNRWFEAEGTARFDLQRAETEEAKLALKGKGKETTALAVCDLACGNGNVTEAILDWYHIGSAHSHPSLNSTTDVAPDPSSSVATVQPVLTQATALHPLLQTNMKAALASRPAFIPPNRQRPSAAGAVPAPAPAGPSMPGSTAAAAAAAAAAGPVSPMPVNTDAVAPAAKQIQLQGGQYSSLVHPPNLPREWQTLEILPIQQDETSSTAAFEARLPSHKPSARELSFMDVSLGKLPFPDPEKTYPPSDIVPFPKWDFVVVSFALHLLTEPSELFALLWELSLRADWLIVVGPHKKPFIKDGLGWVRWDLANWMPARHEGFGGQNMGKDDEDEEEEEEAIPEGGFKDSAIEILRDRVRLRVYKSVGGSA